MKKKLILFVALPLVVLTGAAFYAANAIRPLGNPPLEFMEMATLNVKTLQPDEANALNTELRKVDGVRAVSFNENSDLIALAYDPSVTTLSTCIDKIKTVGNFSPSEVDLCANAPKCPIGNVKLMKLRYRSYFDKLLMMFN